MSGPTGHDTLCARNSQDMTAMPALPLHGREVSQVLDFAHGGQAAKRDTGHSPDISWAAAPHTEP